METPGGGFIIVCDNRPLYGDDYAAQRMGFEPGREVDLLVGLDDAKALAALRARAMRPLRPRRS